MTDKVQKIREKVEKIAKSINPFVPDEDGKNSDYEAGKLDAAIQILQIIDSFEEPVRRTSADIESAMQEVEEKSKAFTEAHKGESSNEILAEMRGEETVSIWHDANHPPEIYNNILVRTYDNIVESTKRYNDNLIPWEDRIKRDGITHWCYVEDLLKL